jgi:SAM-dependent methyltransferase
MAESRSDTWAVGEAYERYVGRWSRQAAVQLLQWLQPPPGLAWLDVGCGTGALTAAVLEHAAPRHVDAIDPSAGFIAHARERIANARVSFHVADARALPLADGAIDMAVCGLVLNFVPEPALAVREMLRVARRGATLAAYVWDYAGRMELVRYFWHAAVDLDPAALALDEGRRFPLCQPGELTRLFRDAGLTAIETIALDVPTRFRDFDDYWSPFLGGQGPAPGYAMSLPQVQREALRERIARSLPYAADGSIALIARAWAVRGAVPAR